jgi:site-specific DNA-cytosine methylase
MPLLSSTSSQLRFCGAAPAAKDTAKMKFSKHGKNSKLMKVKATSPPTKVMKVKNIKKKVESPKVFKKPVVAAIGRRVVEIPSQQSAQLDSWGPKLVKKAREIFAAWTGNSSGVRVSACALVSQGKVRVGTDCSGAESPVWALKSMGIPHEHVFSCDWKEHVREFIKATCPPTGKIFTDMLKRRMDDIPAHEVYIAGFPCTPFSTLRGHATKLLREKAAKVFFKCVKVIAAKLPPLVILENVMGIAKVMDRVAKELQKLQGYFIFVVPIDSKDLGEPVARPRYYFILVRRDAAVLSDEQELAKLVHSIRSAAKTEVTDHIVDRMLPNTSSDVQKFISTCRTKQPRCSGVRKSDLKWVEQHKCFRTAHGVPERGSSSSSASTMAGLSTDRQHDAWDALCHRHGDEDIITDLSQSLGRAHVHTEGICPTVTPSGVICVKRAHRIMMPIEKLLVHGFPLHRMTIPASVSDSTLASLGGNTMHVKSVGLALVIGLCLVKGPVPCESPSQVKSIIDKLPRAPRAIFLDRARK